LAKAVEARDEARSLQAAIDTAEWTLDLQLRYRLPAEIDLARFGLWAAQLELGAAAGNAAAVKGDVFTLYYIRDRILQALTPADLTAVNSEIGNLQVAGVEGDLRKSAEAALRLGKTIARIQPLR
jgi:hypothetical protein